MPKCALCQETFPSKVKLVQHFGEAHSIARQRARRSKVAEAIRRITVEADNEEVIVLDEHEDANFITNTRQPLHCSECDDQFATHASFQSHQCNLGNDAKSKKQPVSCHFCGQKCKDRRGAAIHQAFCEKKIKESSDLSQQEVSNNNFASLETNVIGLPTLYECPADDCGAIFKNEDQLVRHVERHHIGEGITIIRSNTPPRSPPYSPQPEPHVPVPRQSTQPPLVTVTMKPHIGKTEGLQDLSLLITPTKTVDRAPEFLDCDTDDSSASKQDMEESSTSITMEEYRALDGGVGGNGEAVLYVAEDGSVLQASQTSCQLDGNGLNNIGREEETFLIITGDDHKIKPEKFTCSTCELHFFDKNLLSEHILKHHNTSRDFSNIQIKSEPMDIEEEQLEDRNEDDEDWELYLYDRRKKYSADVKVEKGKLEYKCSLCKRHFLSELSYQTHVRNKECKTKKFKLPRMFSCHFPQCDSSFFKLTELQRHWQIAHKFSMATKNVEFEDERTFTDWLAEEEEKHKVRFTCDVKRRKPHRTERLLVCHRFHHLRTAAARKSAKREYSDRHNWIHKIQACLCFARMKVYQDFNEETCDYTGKISVVYYFEHSHPDNESREGKEEILDHILQRNKRNRNTQFQDLKGNEKLLHRQKLEKFARIAGREYRSSIKSTKMSDSVRKFKKESEDHPVINEVDEDQIAAVQVANNLLGSDELFASQVEMVLDGQFDMGHEVLAGSVVTHLDNLPIFGGDRVEQSSYRDDEEGQEKNDTKELEEEESTMQAVLPASTADWEKLFALVRSRVSSEDNNAIKAEAALVLPYEKVIELVSPSEQIPIFRQLWELAYPTSQSQDCVQLEIRMVR
ncbi:uncharacterized protein LOC121874587 [Homarus americanus]|uniref:C2H2-type domain-containing protein n=1 Tax=Homarus americanus TaxID=6706 RepID=A0A8J5JNU8_HOMAM|nr:uncharacterized protein LOC121874587 [Homarus americanus]KAG7161837.1 hypothetical protein Hamer_G007496 [Homarus americanus]